MPIEVSRQPAAPARKKAATSSKPKQDETSTRDARAQAVRGVFELVTIPLTLTGNYADVGAVKIHSPGIATELANVAENQETLAKAIDSLNYVGPYAALVAAIMPLAFQIAVNHNRLPASAAASAGVVPKESLEAQVKASMARQQAEAMQAQHEAEAELEAANNLLNGGVKSDANARG